MEDYLYEKKKKFEMLKNKNKLKSKDAKFNDDDIKLQKRQCEKNILRNYEFKSKNKELTPMKQKVMLKKRQSTERNLMLNCDVTDEEYCTNTICLQEEEFNLDEINNVIGNRDESNLTAVVSNYDNDDDIVFSKRGSSLNFRNIQSYDGSQIEIVQVSHDPDSPNGYNRRFSSNETVDNSQQEFKKKNSSVSSIIQKPGSILRSSSSNILKKVKSFIQNSDSNVNVDANDSLGNHRSISRSTTGSSSSADISGTEQKKKGSKNKLFKSLSKSSNKESKKKEKSEKGSSDSKFFSKKTFSLNSFRLKTKSNVSINNNENHNHNHNQNQNQNKNQNDDNETKPLSRRNSLKKVVRKISSLTKFGSYRSIDGGKKESNSNLENNEINDNENNNNNGEKKILSIGKIFKLKKIDR